MATADVDAVFRVLDLTGVFANALVGGAIARHERLDPVGFATLAVLSGLGGGMLRDVLLQTGPPAALVDTRYLFVAFAGALISFLIRVEGKVWDAWLWPIIDAVALGCWATTGAQKTLGVGLGWLVAILLGIVTAVGGGAIREVVLRRIPTILGGNHLYATAAGIGAAGFVVLSTTVSRPAGQLTGLCLGAGVCILARWRGWMLPDADAWRTRTVDNLKTYVWRPQARSKNGAVRRNRRG